MVTEIQSEQAHDSNDSNRPDSVARDFPGWLWGMAGLAVLWNLMGVLAFVGHMTVDPETVSEDPAVVQLYQEIPMWVNVCFGTAVIAGTLGSLLLMFRSKWSIVLFLVSLIGLAGQHTYMYLISDALSVLGWGQAGFALCVAMVAVWLLVVSVSANRQGYLH